MYVVLFLDVYFHMNLFLDCFHFFRLKMYDTNMTNIVLARMSYDTLKHEEDSALQAKLLKISLMNYSELQDEEKSIRFDIKFGIGDIDSCHLRLEAVHKRHRWLKFFAVVKALLLVFSTIFGVGLVILMVYSLFVYIIIPNDRTAWLLLLIVPYLGCNMAGIVTWMQYQLYGMDSKEARRYEVFGETPTGEIVATFSFFGNLIFLGIVKWFSSMWQSDMKLFANGGAYERLGWRYDVIWYTTMVTICVYAILAFVDLCKMMYKSS